MKYGIEYTNGEIKWFRTQQELEHNIFKALIFGIKMIGFYYNGGFYQITVR